MNLIPLLIITLNPVIGPTWADTIENFEADTLTLLSFPLEDADPDSWSLDSIITPGNSHLSLKLYGNTWKIEQIPAFPIDSSTVLAVAAYIQHLGEIQGFGLVANNETLLYSFAGSEKVNPERWITVYQGAFPLQTWNIYLLPIGTDWLSRFGNLPQITGLVYINDADSNPPGTVFFDDILNITPDLPIAPQLEIWHEILPPIDNHDGSYHVTVQFYSRVTDPDSRHHSYYWYFGDDSTSNDSCPVHTYLITDDHLFTVLCEVCDSTNHWARDTTRVQIEIGKTSLPLKLNFVGDIMLARRYELPGGIIDSLGPEGVFARVKPLLGDPADITTANLECPLTNQGTPHPTKPIVFRGRPTNVRGLAYAGIDLVSLANNHILDYGLPGLNQTRAVLETAGIRATGAGADEYQAFQPAFLIKSGINFAFLAFSDRTGQYDNYQPYLNAGFNKPGFAEQDSFRMYRAINQARTSADYLIIQLHAGEEYQEIPNSFPDDEWYSPLAEKPGLNAINLRHRLIDNGADLIICHHPHILQAIEVYHGKVIAHSLGNFAFDQEYPETYPTIILNSLLDQNGFSHFTLTPIFIDDYLPTPATGELAINILRHLARLSRELNTILLVNRQTGTALVVLDTTELLRQTHSHWLNCNLVLDSGWFISMPLKLTDSADISRIINISPPGKWQIRLGRDLIWFGNMEDEGATMWQLNQPDEFYDTTACRGYRSLTQRRPARTGTIITNLEERPPLPADTGDLTVYLWLKGENAGTANINLNLYNSRTGGMLVKSCSLQNSPARTFNWQFLAQPTTIPAGAQYFDLLLKSTAPDSGTGRVWFDDVGVIKWTTWQEFTPGTTIPVPNEFNWLQIRLPDQTDTAQIQYQTLTYLPLTGLKTTPPAPQISPTQLTITPSLTRNQVKIRFNLPAPAFINLKIYNPAGQQIRTLITQRLTPGTYQLNWDLRDDHGKPVPAGTYFCRLTAPQPQTQKLIITNKQ